MLDAADRRRRLDAGELAPADRLTMIDDHEVTNDFAGGAEDSPGTLVNDTSLFESGLTAFVEYHPILPTFWAHAVGSWPRQEDASGRLGLTRSSCARPEQGGLRIAR